MRGRTETPLNQKDCVAQRNCGSENKQNDAGKFL